jgi:hypothetical protein
VGERRPERRDRNLQLTRRATSPPRQLGVPSPSSQPGTVDRVGVAGAERRRRGLALPVATRRDDRRRRGSSGALVGRAVQPIKVEPGRTPGNESNHPISPVEGLNPPDEDSGQFVRSKNIRLPSYSVRTNVVPVSS